MALLPLSPTTLPLYLERINCLTESASRHWGSMSSHEMLNHVRQLIEVALGERTMPDFSNWASRRRFAQWLLVDVLPWPRGRIKAPIKMLDDELAPFEQEREQLLASLRRFTDVLEQHPDRLVASPLLGPITLRFWSRIHGKHLDHHLRQFGV